MKIENKTLRWIYFFTLKAIRLPLLFMLLGIGCILLAALDKYLLLSKWGQNLLHLNKWKYSFDVILEPIGQALIVMSVIATIYRFLSLYCRHKEHDFQQKKLHFPILMLATVRKGLRIFYLFLMLYSVIYILASDQIYFVYLNKLIYVLLVLTICWVLLEIVQTIEHVISHYASINKSHDQHRAKDWHTKAQIIRNLLTVLIVFITIVALLMSFDNVKNIGLSLLASAGFLTAIVGFSAQKTLASFFAGMQIAFSQRIKIGDYVVIDNEQGVIEYITLTYVAVKIHDHRQVIIPINFFIDKSFENWSRAGDMLKGEVFLYLTYAVDLDVIRKELARFLKSSPLWDRREMKAQLSGFKNYTVEVRLRFSANDPDRLSNLKSDSREHMLNFLRANHPDYLPSALYNQQLENE